MYIFQAHGEHIVLPAPPLLSTSNAPYFGLTLQQQLSAKPTAIPSGTPPTRHMNPVWHCLSFFCHMLSKSFKTAQKVPEKDMLQLRELLILLFNGL